MKYFTITTWIISWHTYCKKHWFVRLHAVLAVYRRQRLCGIRVGHTFKIRLGKPFPEVAETHQQRCQPDPACSGTVYRPCENLADLIHPLQTSLKHNYSTINVEVYSGIFMGAITMACTQLPKTCCLPCSSLLPRSSHILWYFWKAWHLFQAAE